MRIKSQITKLAISCIYQLIFGVSSSSLCEFLSRHLDHCPLVV